MKRSTNEDQGSIVHQHLLETFGKPLFSSTMKKLTETTCEHCGLMPTTLLESTCDQCGMMEMKIGLEDPGTWEDPPMKHYGAPKKDRPKASTPHSDAEKEKPPFLRRKNDVEESAPPGGEKVVRALKKNKDVDNAYAVAWSMKNRGEI